MGKKNDTSKKAATSASPNTPTKTVKKPAVAAAQPAVANDATPAAQSSKEPVAAKTATPKKTAAKTATPKKAKAAEKVVRPSADDVALRAYFIAEKRQREGQPGDSTSDWVEAERQLMAELNGSAALKEKPAAK